MGRHKRKVTACLPAWCSIFITCGKYILNDYQKNREKPFWVSEMLENPPAAWIQETRTVDAAAVPNI